jgi:hypothetical protein
MRIAAREWAHGPYFVQRVFGTREWRRLRQPRSPKTFACILLNFQERSEEFGRHEQYRAID